MGHIVATVRSRLVYFQKLILGNVRSFGGIQELILTDDKGRPAQWTLILGDNGVGKTTLLQCLAGLRPTLNVETSDELDSGAPDIVEPWILQDENRVIESLARIGDDVAVRLEATFIIGPRLGRQSTKPRILQTGLSFRSRPETVDKIEDVEALKEKVPGFTEPLVLGYGAGRHVGFYNRETVDAESSVASLFDPAAELYDAEEIFLNLDHARLRKNRNATRVLKGLKAALAAILPDIDRPSDIIIYGPRTPGDTNNQTGVHAKTPYGEVPLSQLSLGYQTVTAWTVDVAWRLFEHCPDSPNPLHEPAVVLVDEIDLHLHPKWQRKFRRDLAEHFPNVQFIATAHSPLMAQTLLDENLAVVRREDDHAVIVNDPAVVKDWRLDQIITSELFDQKSARPPDIEQMMEDRVTLLRKTDLSKDEKARLAKLDQELDELTTGDPADQSAMDIIRRAAALLGPEHAPDDTRK